MRQHGTRLNPTARFLILFIFSFLFILVLDSFSTFAAQCADIRENVLRLHILANSDSVEDQELKLRVRDRILQETDSLFYLSDSLETAEEKAQESLPRIEEIARDELLKWGCNDEVHAEPVSYTHLIAAEVDNVNVAFHRMDFLAGINFIIHGNVFVGVNGAYGGGSLAAVSYTHLGCGQTEISTICRKKSSWKRTKSTTSRSSSTALPSVMESKPGSLILLRRLSTCLLYTSSGNPPSVDIGPEIPHLDHNGDVGMVDIHLQVVEMLQQHAAHFRGNLR